MHRDLLYILVGLVGRFLRAVLQSGGFCSIIYNNENILRRKVYDEDTLV